MTTNQREQKLIGNIRLTKRIGRGGMGDVWVGYHEGLQAVVAVKIPNDNNPELVERLLTEARSQYKLRDDPYIAKIHDVQRDPPHIVMEFVDGKDLETYVYDHRHELQDVHMQIKLLELLHKVALSLHRAHNFQEAGVKSPIIHRDIKPENILVIEGQYGALEPRTIDWGIARIGFNPKLTNSATLMGSMLYFSPEQCRNPEDVDGKTDVWAMGLTIFKVLTGEDFYDNVPLSGPEADNAIIRVIEWWQVKEGEDEPARIKERLLALPEWARRIVEPCVKVDRNKRIDMMKLAKLLEGGISYLKQEMRQICGSVTEPVITPQKPQSRYQETLCGMPDTLPSPAMSAMMQKVAALNESKPRKKETSFTTKASIILGVILLVLGGAMLIMNSMVTEPTADDAKSPSAKASVPDAGRNFKSRFIVADARVPRHRKRLVTVKTSELPPPPKGDIMPSDEYIEKLYAKKDSWCLAHDPKRHFYHEARSHHSKCIRDAAIQLYKSGHRGTALLLLDELSAHFCIWVYTKFNKDMVRECEYIKSTRKRFMYSLVGKALIEYDRRLRKRWQKMKDLRQREISRVLEEWKRKRRKPPH